MTNRHAAAEDVGTVWVNPGEAVTNYTVTALHPVHTNITASERFCVLAEEAPAIGATNYRPAGPNRRGLPEIR